MAVAPVVRAITAIIFIALNPVASATETSIAYTVQPKDELIKMAAEFFRDPDDWKEVAVFNHLANPDAIHPGQIIHIPVRLVKLQSVAGKLVSVTGDVRLAGARVAVGAVVPEGARLQTGPNSSAVLELADTSRVTLLPRTLAELVASKGYALRKPTSSDAGQWFAGLMRLTTGVLETRAAKNANRASPLQIETPTSVVGVRGTQFRVGYDGSISQSARTEVLEGLVRADNPAQGTGTDLPLGTGAIIHPAVKEIRVVDLLKPPRLAGLPSDVFKPRALWPMPVLAGAARYRAQISGDADFSRIVRDVVVTRESAQWSDLPNGVWFVRVRGIDANGLEGYDSVKMIQVLIPPAPAQAPRQWLARADRLEVINGHHILQFEAQGLDASHVILATVKTEKPPYTRLAKALVSAGAGPVIMDLGELHANEKYQLNLTVAQEDGATLSPTDYRFEGLGAGGHVTGALRPLPTGAR